MDRRQPPKRTGLEHSSESEQAAKKAKLEEAQRGYQQAWKAAKLPDFKRGMQHDNIRISALKREYPEDWEEHNPEFGGRLMTTLTRQESARMNQALNQPSITPKTRALLKERLGSSLRHLHRAEKEAEGIQKGPPRVEPLPSNPTAFQDPRRAFFALALQRAYGQ